MRRHYQGAPNNVTFPGGATALSCDRARSVITSNNTFDMAEADQSTRSKTRSFRSKKNWRFNSCTNTRPHYFLGTASPRISTAIVHQLDTSVDNLWAHTLLFPQDYAQSSTGLARASQSSVDPNDPFCPDLIRGLGGHARESRSGAARRAPRIACLLARIRARRRHSMRHTTTCGGIMSDAVLVCTAR